MRRTFMCFILLAGCGGSRAVENEFLAALPQRQQVQIAFPDGSAGSASSDSHSSALIGQTAEFYAVTRVTSEHLNGLVGSALGTLAAITRMPPSHVEQTRAVWGPFTPVLSPVNYRLIIERAAPGQFAHRLDGRPKAATAEEAFGPVIAGVALRERSSGNFSIDLNRLHALDPVGTPESGGIALAFEMTPQQGSIHIHLEGLAGGDPARVSADYIYIQLSDGSGDFLFAAHPAISGVSADLQGALIRSRWNPSGAGRADVHVAGDPAGERDITECWNESFLRVFFSVRPGPSEGDPALCAYAEPPPAPI